MWQRNYVDLNLNEKTIYTMKNCYMLAIGLLFGFACHAQEDKNNGLKVVRTEPNGIVIYEAQGVETVEAKPATPQVVEREAAPTFLQLTIPELEVRLYQINMKLQLAKDEEDPERIAIYEEHVRQTTERIEALKKDNK